MKKIIFFFVVVRHPKVRLAEGEVKESLKDIFFCQQLTTLSNKLTPEGEFFERRSIFCLNFPRLSSNVKFFLLPVSQYLSSTNADDMEKFYRLTARSVFFSLHLNGRGALFFDIVCVSLSDTVHMKLGDIN